MGNLFTFIASVSLAAGMLTYWRRWRRRSACCRDESR
jgi:hypothetical protein